MAGKMSFSAEEVARICGGTLHGSASWHMESVCHDTRLLQAGEVFVALAGAHGRGEDFLDAARSKGAVAALVAEVRATDLPQVRVENPLQALSALAAERRSRSAAWVTALTGSNGKTTTKEMLARILSREGETLATAGNYNNDIGVPLTLLRLQEHHRFAVVEMGANHAGEIAALTRLTRPDAALITNVSAAHLQGFGSVEGVFRAKAEIYRESESALVINADLPQAEAWLREFSSRRIKTFSLAGNGDIIAPFVSPDGSSFSLQISGQTVEVSWRLQGRHNVENALAACAAASLAGITPQQMAEALNRLTLRQSRLSAFSVGQHMIYDDTYNANPASFRAGIDVIAAAPHPLVIAGAMGELGAEEEMLHRQVYEYALSRGVKRFWTLNAPAYGGEDFSSVQALGAALRDLLAGNSAQTVLVKGSRSSRMERIFAAAGLEDLRKG